MCDFRLLRELRTDSPIRITMPVHIEFKYTCSEILFEKVNLQSF